MSEESSTPPAEEPARCPYGYGKAEPPAVPTDHPTPVPAGEESKAAIGGCPYKKKAQTEERDTADDTDGVDVHDASAVTAAPDAIKKHFATRYNEVSKSGRTAPSKARVELARRSQKKIGYTDEDLDLVGDDVALMQGVNNPHDAAAYREGDTVLDLGCGMGVDTRVAAARVGTSGRAIGLDLSAGEVAVAQQRAKDLKLTNVDYRVGDMEDLPFGDASIDVVISNGGFCLVPSKEKAFREIYRVLRPGGRVSIACTVRRQLLDSTDILPLLTSLGYEDVAVDTSNSRMDAQTIDETDIEAAAQAAGVCTHAIRAQLRRQKQHGTGSNSEEKSSGEGDVTKRTTVHTGESQFSHLKNYNMSDLCARVIIQARKPPLCVEDGEASACAGCPIGAVVNAVRPWKWVIVGAVAVAGAVVVAKALRR